MKKRLSPVLPLLPIAILLLLWEYVVHRYAIPLYVLPAPSKVLQALWQNGEILYAHTLITLGEALLGLASAAILGCLLALLMDAMPNFKRMIHPLLVTSQSIPMLVLAPLFVIYLGFGIAPKVVTITLMCFFPIAISLADGLNDVDSRLCDLVLQMGASKQQVYRMVKIPGALTALFSGLHVAATYSILGAVVAEWLGGEGGLGFYMLRVKNTYMLDRVFAVLIIIIALSILLNLCFSALRRWVTPWNK